MNIFPPTCNQLALFSLNPTILHCSHTNRPISTIVMFQAAGLPARKNPHCAAWAAGREIPREMLGFVPWFNINNFWLYILLGKLLRFLYSKFRKFVRFVARILGVDQFCEQKLPKIRILVENGRTWNGGTEKWNVAACGSTNLKQFPFKQTKILSWCFTHYPVLSQTRRCASYRLND